MGDQDETNPIVPHNSEVDCRPSGSPAGTGGSFSRRERRNDISFWENQPAKSSVSNGRGAIESLRSRLYDRPENSEVYRAIIRPVPPPLPQSTQAVPHPPTKSGNRSAMGNYRTTLFRRDFNRLQAQRNQGFPKEPVSVKQGTAEPRKESISKASDSAELESQLLMSLNGSDPFKSGPEFISPGMAKMEHTSEVSDDRKSVGQAQSVSSLGGISDEGSSFVASWQPPRSRPISHKPKVSSARSGSPHSMKQTPHVNANVPLTSLYGSVPFTDDEFLGLSVTDVIRKLRHRLNMSTDLDAIADGFDPDEDVNNINRLYIKEDDGKFLYCLPKNRGVRGARYNPYDLICVTSKEAQAATQYFTITASAVTQTREGFDSDLTPLKRWLYERKSFNTIFVLPTFSNFRLWKGYTCWKNNVRFQKNSSSSSEVCSCLFSARKALQQAILRVRALCERACSSITGVGEKEHAICLLHFDNKATFTLDEFVEAQSRQAEHAMEKLAKLRMNVVEIVKEACELITDEEGLTEWIHPRQKRELASKKKKTGKGGDGQPTFTQMSQWRGVLRRLKCFIRMIDFLVMELLRRLVLTALRTLLAQVKTSSLQGPIVNLSLMEPTLEVDEKADTALGQVADDATKSVELLKVQLVLNFPVREEVVDRKTVTFDFHGTPRPENGGGSFLHMGDGTLRGNTNTGNFEIETSDLPYESESIKKTYKSFISLNPTEQELEAGIFNIVYGFEQTAASFKSLVHDPELSIYIHPPASDVVYALSRDVEEEEKAKKVAWPDTGLLFGQDPDYQNDVGQIFNQIKEEVENVLNYAKQYRKYCAMVDKSRGVDVDGSLKEREWNTEEFYFVLNQHTEQVLDMKEMRLHKRVGLFHVDITQFQKDCLPFPEKVLEAVSRHLPVIAARRNDVLLNVIKRASRKLDKAPESVEAFVEHLIFLSRMASDISSLEHEYNVVTRMYSIARNFDMSISDEELALYRTLMPSFQHLKSTILYCEAKRDENIVQFTRALDELIGNVRRELIIIKNKVCSPALLDADNIPQVATEKLKLLKEDLSNLSTKARNYAAYQERFGNSMSSSLQKKSLTEGSAQASQSNPQASSLQSELSEVERDLTLRCLLWESLQEWQGLVDQWEATPFDTLKIDDVQQNVTRFIQTIFLLEKGLPPNKVVPKLKQMVTSFKQGLPVITSLRNSALRTRHWEAIQNVIGTRIVRDKYFTLGHLLQLQVFQHKEKISDISSQASNEATLEEMLQKVMDFWNHTDFALSAHPSRDIAIITGADDIITAVEESQATLANIRGSRFVTPIKALVEEWDRKLELFARTIDEWLVCQRNWLYLETIFSAADIQRQLPNEARLFAQVDKSWRDIMRRTIDKPNALKAATSAGVLEVLQASNSHLEKIHRCLEDYLETKRLVFARFYFLSNEDLLDILANSKNPNAVQPHLRKCFGNIHQLGIVRQAHAPAQIKTMTSEEGETVQLPKTLRARGTVESWLFNVEQAMYETVKMHLKKCLSDYGITYYKEWVLAHPGQAVLTVSQIIFNRDVLTCFHTTRPKDALLSKREKLVPVLHSLSQMVTSPLVPHQHKTLEALLTIEVHARDVLDSMISNHVFQQDDFEWARQLRYEWNDDKQACLVRHSNAVFEYGYEYLGCHTRLVITPLTDRCFLTLTGALNLHLNGAPAGPAGTGKTETVKDLAKAMGKQCLVFNCSEGLDYKMMGKFFSGLAQSGSWFCFDEFNRIDVEVLSVIAQQLHTIKTAKDNRATRFLFEGRDIKINPDCGVFITMNPGYAGRVELPDNLKSLFRPVAMMIPDYALIAEIILFSEGFTTAALLSRKVVNLYQLASKQLSQQDHYDFGLRAIKSILLMAGQRRRAASLSLESETLEEEESHMIINAVKDANIPKFVAEDVPLFKSILADLFPGMDPPGPDNKLLKKAARSALGELSIQYWPKQIDKVIQLNSTLQVRHGVMLVGPTGGGKTTTRQILKRAIIALPTVQAREQQQQQQQYPGPGEDAVETGSSKTGLSYLRPVKTKRGSVQVSTLNPKCVTVGELYGEFNPTTMEWKDGLLSHIFRKYAKFSRGVMHGSGRKPSASSLYSPYAPRPSSAKSRALSAISVEENSEVETVAVADEGSDNNKEDGLMHWRWIVMDGPVDTLWIENLNTVLDDTKVLCLANGERIDMGQEMRILFEVDNLAMASPATVSRCGMVYMDPEDLGWRPYVKKWIQRLQEKTKLPREAFDHLNGLFEQSIDVGLSFLSTYNSLQFIPAPNLSIVSALCNIFGGFIEILNSQGGLSDTGFVNAGKEGVESSETTSAKSVAFAEKSEEETRTRELSFVQRNPSQLLSFLGKLYVFAFTWSFGGNLNSRYFAEDEDFGYSYAKNSTPAWHIFDTLIRELFENTVRLPPGSESIANYYVDMENGQFTLWSNLVPTARALIAKAVSNQFAISDTLNILDDPPPLRNQIEIDRSLVPTVDTVRYSFLVALMALNGQPVLLNGESGVGKSALLQDILVRLSQSGGTGIHTGTILGAVFRKGGKNLVENIMDVAANSREGGKAKESDSELACYTTQFSAYTSATKARKFIESKLVKRGRDVLGPRPGKKVLLFLDDLNMPQPDAYQSQPPLELLRQILDSRGFYDSDKLQWKEVHDVTLLSACGPPGGGRSAINGRLLRHFSVLCLPNPSHKWLHHIYTIQLGRFLEKADFTPEVRQACENLVTSAMGIYFDLKANLLPTPAKSHYTFNLRDLNKVIEGLLQAHPSVITSRDHCCQLLGHEASRVLHDRLTNDSDRRYFYRVLSNRLRNDFNVRWTPLELEQTPLIFGDFLEGSSPQDGLRPYRFVRQYDRLPQVLEEYYDKAKLSAGSIDHRFVFFDMAIQHVTRAARVFRQLGKHMHMVGVGGTGKATVAKLAAFIENCVFLRPFVSRTYNLVDFRDDLKKASFRAGVKGHNTVLFLTDNLVKDNFLEDITSMLSGSDISNLFDHEDLERISLDLKKEATNQGIADTKEAIFHFFHERVKEKLHVVLSTTPAGTTFRRRCRLYPPLINCCTIDWFDKWPLDALHSVAVSFLEGSELSQEQESNSTLMDSIPKVFVAVYQSVEDETQKFYDELHRRYYTTPTSYMEFVRLFLCKLKEKRAEFSLHRDRLCTGLQKLSESNSLVGTMQTELLQLGPKLEKKAKDTEKILEQLAGDQEAVDQVHVVVQKEEEIMNEEAMRVQAIAEEAQSDLEGALPQLEAAIAALDALDKSDISEIRVYTKPPAMVMTVLSAVCLMLQQKPDWNTAKLLLADPGFLKRLVAFDKSSVPEKVFTRLKRYTQHPDFNPEAVGKISVACKSMCQWVLALENYAEVYKIVQPKQRRCEEAQAALSIAKENLQQKQISLSKIQEQLELLQQQYDNSVAQLEELRQKKELTIIRLQRASLLTASLAEEQVRWKKAIHIQETQSEGLVGGTLVSSAAVAYLGAFTSPYRNRLLAHWLELCRKENIPVSDNFELTEFLSEPVEIQKWVNKELPHDKHSIENAVLIKHCRRWPLLIDPQEQASHWITQTEKVNGLKIVKASDPSYIRTLESAIPLGQPVLVEDVGESLDPSLNPILSKNTIQRGNHSVILIGETEIEYNSNFRLYMTTPLANPHFLPEVCIKVTVINFTVTVDGLQDQLLSRVVQKERPKLEESRRELLQGLVNDRYKLRELEDRSLSLLHSSRGNILDDQDLISTLDESKKMANVIHSRVHQSEETEEKINSSREGYLPVATRGAVLYFVLTDLAYIDVMYQFSLPWFTDLFEKCIESAQEPAQNQRSESPIAPGSAGTLRPVRKNKAAASVVSRPSYKRKPSAPRLKDIASFPEYLEALVMLLTESVYRVVSYALFARHKLTFSFMLCAGIMRHSVAKSFEATIKEEEWNWFVRGSAVAAISDRLENEEDLDSGVQPSSIAVSRTIATGSMGQYLSKMNKSPAKWISESTWKECLQLSSSVTSFSGMCSDIAVNVAFWSKFSLSENPFQFLKEGNMDTDDSPAVVEGKDQIHWDVSALTGFQHLIIIKILRPECLVESVRLFVKEQLGSMFVTSVGFDLQEIFQESSNRKPLIFILSPGSDPTSQLIRFARQIRGTALHLDIISLGRGQGPRTEEAITKAYHQKGKWVFLQNCHHAESFMPRLQMIVRRISHPETVVDPNFRIWLSSKPDPSFPVSILQAGLKMTVEPPPGIKANLLRCLGGLGGVVTESVWEDTGPGPAWKKLVFGLCFFNAVVHERKKFGALGWNIPYEFTASDLEVSILMLNMLLTEHREVPWKAIKYLTGDIAYGGRVTDSWDQRCLQAILEKFYSPEALQESYGYTKDYVYRPPPSEISLSVCCEYIDSLPAADAPELFGMDQNANTAFLASQGRALIGNLLAAQPRLKIAAVSSNKTNDDIVLELVNDALKYLPERVDSTSHERSGVPPDPRRSLALDFLKQLTHKSHETSGDHSEQTLYVTVLHQEIKRFDRLLGIIHSSLSSLQLAVKGEVLMSEQLDETYNALLNNRVPKAWEQFAYESCKPLGAWIDNLAKRVDFFNGWLASVSTDKTSKARMSREPGPASPSSSQSSFSKSAPRNHPNAFWLPAFFFPQGFLTAVLQAHARENNVPVDSLSFCYHVLKDKWARDDSSHGESSLDFKRIALQASPPEEGIVIFGLYLDGASWDSSQQCMQDSLPGQRFYPLPHLQIIPIQNSAAASDTKVKQDIDEAELRVYECPLYRTSLRASSLTSTGHTTNYVMSVSLPSVQPAGHWITRGVALLCQLDE